MPAEKTATEIVPLTPDALFNDAAFPALVDAYRREAARDASLIGAPPDLAHYRDHYQRGRLMPLGLFQAGQLVGFAAVQLEAPPHAKGCLIASCEALYVQPCARRFGGGRALLDAMQAQAKVAGACSFYLAAPTGGRLENILPRLGFSEVSRFFMRPLVHQQEQVNG